MSRPEEFSFAPQVLSGKYARDPEGISLLSTIQEQRDYMATNEKVNQEHIFAAYGRTNEMTMRVDGLERNVADLRREVNFWRAKHDEVLQQLKAYQGANQQMSGTNYSNLTQMHKMQAERSCITDQLDLALLKNQEMEDTIKKLSIENDSLRYRLDNFEEGNKLSMANITCMLSQKGKDVNDMKWKLNDALELKRRVETDSESMKFEIENLRSRYVADMKEKDLRLAQQERNFQDSIDLKAAEWRQLMDRYVRLEHDYNLLHEENRRLMTDNENLKLQVTHHKLTYGNTVDRFEYGCPTCGHNPNAQMPHIKVSSGVTNIDALTLLIEITQKKHDQETKRLLMQIWMLKFKCRMLERQEAQLVKIRTGSLAPTGDIGDTRTIGEGLLILLTYLRDDLVELIFELFVRSISGANKKKTNSLILFILNVREFKSAQKEVLIVAIELYMKLRALAKRFIPNFSSLFARFAAQIADPVKAHRASSKINDDNFFRMDQEPTSEVFRDNINTWIENTLSICVTKHNSMPNEKNRDFLFLYRLLTIAYRIRYPLRGKELNPDVDLKIYLDHKICSALRKVMLANSDVIIN